MGCRSWRTRRLVVVAGIVFGVVLPGSVLGQTWQVDLNGTAARYDTATRAASLAVAPQFGWSGTRSLVIVGGTVAGLEGSSLSTQGRGDGWLFVPTGGRTPVGLSLSAGAGGSVHSGGYHTGTTRAEGRLMFGRGAGGAWTGLAAGTGWTSSTASGVVGAWGPTAGIWGQGAGWTGSIVVRPFRLQQSWFTELGAFLMLTQARVDLSGFAGWRSAPANTGVRSVAWGGASLVARVTRHVGLTASAGTYPADFLQALPGGRYLAVGLRFANRFPVPAPREPAAVYVPARRASGGEGGQELRFTVAGATRVDVVSDWTGWDRVPLQRGRGNSWTLRVSLRPGLYRFNLVVDGERWIVPPEVRAVDDGLGGKTGLLVVP